jgi:hypothetical protein
LVRAIPEKILGRCFTRPPAASLHHHSHRRPVIAKPGSPSWFKPSAQSSRNRQTDETIAAPPSGVRPNREPALDPIAPDYPFRHSCLLDAGTSSRRCPATGGPPQSDPVPLRRAATQRRSRTIRPTSTRPAARRSIPLDDQTFSNWQREALRLPFPPYRPRGRDDRLCRQQTIIARPAPSPSIPARPRGRAPSGLRGLTAQRGQARGPSRPGNAETRHLASNLPRLPVPAHFVGHLK